MAQEDAWSYEVIRERTLKQNEVEQRSRNCKDSWSQVKQRGSIILNFITIPCITSYSIINVSLLHLHHPVQTTQGSHTGSTT